jgi:hypothetical protein
VARASACSGELQFAVVHPEAAIGAKPPAEAGSSTLKRAPQRDPGWEKTRSRFPKNGFARSRAPRFPLFILVGVDRTCDPVTPREESWRGCRRGAGQERRVRVTINRRA